MKFLKRKALQVSTNGAATFKIYTNVEPSINFFEKDFNNTASCFKYPNFLLNPNSCKNIFYRKKHLNLEI